MCFSSWLNGIFLGIVDSVFFIGFYGANVGVCSVFSDARHARVHVLFPFSHGGSLDNDKD